MSNSRPEIERAFLGATSIDRHFREEKRMRDLMRGFPSDDIAALTAGVRQPISDLNTVRELAKQQQMLRDLAHPFGGVAEMARDAARQQNLLQRWIEDAGGIDVFNHARREHWAAALAGPSPRELAALAPNFSRIMSEVSRAHEEALAIIGGGRRASDVLAETLRLPDMAREALGLTSTKMSVLAGIADTSGVSASAYDEAVYGLLGTWRSHPDLPASFWQDRRVRERRYRRAEVDPGLLVIPPAVTVEVLVESGLAAGASDDQGSIALLSYGGVTVSIRSGNARVDAYRGVVAFETQLRDFIATKLSAHAGPKWFKQRVDGEVFAKAKATRETALKSGEQSADLINYTELGELMGIVLRKDNWDQVFEQVFINRGRFQHDMQTLQAVRRPTAHARIVDSPAMLEAFIVMDRLNAQMSDDGGWTLRAAADE